MAATLRFDGMAEFRAALRKLPEDLAGEASNIVEATANGVAAQVRGNYPIGPTGNLVRGVTVTHFENRKVAAGAIVKSVAKHAWIFERGTKVRSGAGGNERGRGSRRGNRLANRSAMPEAPESQQMVPVVVRYRRRMFEQLFAMLRRHGFTVGD